MKDVLEALLLGALQGLTEFLPISSSGHLKALEVLRESRWASRLTLDIAVHGGTLLVVIVVFRRDLRDLLGGLARRAGSRRLLGWLALATVPAAAAGLLGRELIETLPGSWPPSIAAGWTVTGIALLLLGRRDGTRGLERLRAGPVLAVGLAQAAALVPGISRSGATISAGVRAGLRREAAARFSFLLSIPAIAGAAALELITEGLDPAEIHILAAGFLGAAVTGWGALRALLWLLGRGRLWLFAPYTFVAAAAYLALLAR